MLLELNDATLAYGKIEALHGISMEVDEGEVVAMIGAPYWPVEYSAIAP